MAKTFYTERDIEDLFSRGVTNLTVGDEVVVTDLARERAMKLGFSLVKLNDKPPSAPERPYIAKSIAMTKTTTHKSETLTSKSDLEVRVYNAVVSRVGDSVDEKLLKTIISRVLQSVGGK